MAAWVGSVVGVELANLLYHGSYWRSLLSWQVCIWKARDMISIGVESHLYLIVQRVRLFER